MRTNIRLGLVGLVMTSIFVLGPGAGAQQGFKSSLVLQTTTTSIGQPILFPLFRNEVRAFLIELAPGGEVGRHRHPVPTFVYVLEGTFTVETDGHPPRQYQAGQGYVEAMGTWHNGLNRGTTPVKFLVVYAAEEGRPTAVRP
ncbi:MAG: cupin domain-containing protein [Armatimonadota bacterium]|nr:cupin domain-containing protein [Armatimonadota bacterium]MDR7448702.1 cupin domain-containing protein [Armatimonadota bacterium]MDR7460278.1 cupin domain-containing protein [Armatimonadota bacterium]MDR7479040.1 cupin domain-containing protein [Armatimonadota bacterium]MDR7502671.1 cupin domain-containing protein [Armatimonadota bacterium]